MDRARPNILLITSDQQHWNTVGCLNAQVSTPTLDKLAASGTMFTRAYCPNPTCTPTRASIITGQYPSQHGAWALGTKLPEQAHTVGEDFQKAGYRTALVGKAHFQPKLTDEKYPSLEAMPVIWDLDFWRKFHGPFYGFEHVELARNHANEALVGQHYAIWMEDSGFANWRDHFSTPTGNSGPQKRRWSIPEKYHYDAWIAERTNALLEEYQKQGENFFVWASFFDPHPQYLVPEPWDTMYDPALIDVPGAVPGEHERNPIHYRLTQEADPDFSAWNESGWGNVGLHSHLQDPRELAKDFAIYYGMISLMDKYIGKILDRLSELGLADNTLVVFTTDHGHFIGQHGLNDKGPFHYEDMIKVPLIARLPGRITSGERNDAMQSLVDLAPTFLSFSGIEVPRTMIGVDQSGVWTGKQTTARDHVIVENRQEPTTIHMKTYVDKRYKITVYHNHWYGELFDLHNDPGELNNLWADPDHCHLKMELTMKLLFAEMEKEPLWMPRNALA